MEINEDAPVVDAANIAALENRFITTIVQRLANPQPLPLPLPLAAAGGRNYPVPAADLEKLLIKEIRELRSNVFKITNSFIIVFTIIFAVITDVSFSCHDSPPFCPYQWQPTFLLVCALIYYSVNWLFGAREYVKKQCELDNFKEQAARQLNRRQPRNANQAGAGAGAGAAANDLENANDGQNDGGGQNQGGNQGQNQGGNQSFNTTCHVIEAILWYLQILAYAVVTLIATRSFPCQPPTKKP